MKTQLGEASTHLKNMKQYHNFPSTEKVTVIGYLDNSKRKREMFFRIGGLRNVILSFKAYVNYVNTFSNNTYNRVYNITCIYL